MEQRITTLLLILIPGVQAARPQKVVLVMGDVPVAQILQVLAEQKKLNLAVSPDVNGTMPLHLTDAPWRQAPQTAIKSARSITCQKGNILLMRSATWQSDNVARQEVEQT